MRQAMPGECPQFPVRVPGRCARLIPLTRTPGNEPPACAWRGKPLAWTCGGNGLLPPVGWRPAGAGCSRALHIVAGRSSLLAAYWAICRSMGRFADAGVIHAGAAWRLTAPHALTLIVTRPAMA